MADTSVVSNLALIGAAKLLPALFGKLIVPGQVWRELLRGAELYERMRFLRDADWLEVRTAPQGVSLTELSKEVDQGEAEAIALALGLKADLLLVDDSDGRMAAMRRGIPIMGLLGFSSGRRKRALSSVSQDGSKNFVCTLRFA